MTELPISRSRFSVSISFALSRSVQADRRLIENIKHSYQPGTDLAGQANALGLSSRESGGLPRPRLR